MLYFIGLGLGDAKDITVRKSLLDLSIPLNYSFIVIIITATLPRTKNWLPYILNGLSIQGLGRGLEVVRKCDKVYLEHYTSVLTCGKGRLFTTFH
jgi:hypothetical protein